METGGGDRDACAQARPETAAALDDYRRTARRWAAAAAALLALAPPLAALDVVPAPIGAQAATVAVPALVLAMRARLLAVRMRAALTRAPWTPCEAVALPTVWGRLHVALFDPATDHLWVVPLHATKSRQHLAIPGASGGLWWCGDPTTGGVLSHPGGAGLVWAGPARTNPTA
ncbi:hypothetical protein GL263_26325, partial [Streptomyces durbertensis]